MNCKLHSACMLLHRNTGRVSLHDIYKVHLGAREGQQVWVVDGDKVVRTLYPAFIMGGNDQRYRFNPDDDIWIDSRIGIEELKYTLAHELIERKLMREKGWSYDRAHVEGGLAVERKLRAREARRCRNKERTTQPVLLGESEDRHTSVTVRLQGVYRQLYRRVKGLSVWIVDGALVRRDIHPDFCFGGHDRKYRFVPAGEIWLDSAMSVEEAHFALTHELAERELMAVGEEYDRAYEGALVRQLDERARQETLALKHEARLGRVRYGVRERGFRKGASRRRPA